MIGKMKKPIAFCLTLVLAFGMWGFMPTGPLAPVDAYAEVIGDANSGDYYITKLGSSSTSPTAVWLSGPAILEDSETLHFRNSTDGAFIVNLSGSAASFTIDGGNKNLSALIIDFTSTSGMVNLTINNLTATGTAITFPSGGSLTLNNSKIQEVDFNSENGTVTGVGSNNNISGSGIDGGDIAINGVGLTITGGITADTTNVAINATATINGDVISDYGDVTINGASTINGSIIAANDVKISANLTVKPTTDNTIAIEATTVSATTTKAKLDVKGGPSGSAISASAVTLNNTGNSTIKAGDGDNPTPALYVGNSLTIKGDTKLDITGGNASGSSITTADGIAIYFVATKPAFTVQGSATINVKAGTSGAALSAVLPAVKISGGSIALSEALLKSNMTAASHSVTGTAGGGYLTKFTLTPNAGSAPTPIPSPSGDSDTITSSNPINRMSDVGGTNATSAPQHWAYEAIEFVLKRHYMNGVSNTEFAPDIAVNRAMVAQVFGNMNNFFANGYKESPYSDVTISEWYGPAAAWANQSGVMAGTGNGKFSPKKNVSREELAVAMYNYAKAKGMNVTVSGDLAKYTDASKVSSWAKDAFIWASAKGVISGKPDGSKVKLDPKGKATRAELASMIYRFDKI